MTEKIKAFLEIKKCANYIISDEQSTIEIPWEDYYFVRSENDMWVLGESHRGKDDIEKRFEFKEEAVLSLLYVVYTGRLQIDLKDDYVLEASKLSGDRQITFTESIFNEEDLDQIRIKNDVLIYKNEHVIENYLLEYDEEIEELQFLTLFDLKAFEQTRIELIEFGIDPIELDKYFRFENLVEL